MEKKIIGSEEWCVLPNLQIPAIKARIDSGAKTSSIHALNITPFKKSGEKWVRYEVFPLQSNPSVSIHCESKISATRYVKSSTGVSEKRYVILTDLVLGEDK